MRGAKVKTTHEAGALGQKLASARTMSAGLVVDQRVHRDDVVEPAKGRVQHVADAEVDVPLPGRRAGVRAARPTSVGERSTAMTSAPRLRRFDRQRAGAAAGVEHAPAAQVVRAASRAACARIRSRPARTVARMRPTGASRGQPRPCLGGGAVEIGFKLPAALDCR